MLTRLAGKTLLVQITIAHGNPGPALNPWVANRSVPFLVEGINPVAFRRASGKRIPPRSP